MLFTEGDETVMNKVRFGIVGYGIQGSSYAGYLSGRPKKGGPQAFASEYCALGGICDINENRRREAEALYPGVPVYNRYEEMIDSKNVDAIITTVPHYLHPEMAVYAINRGVHALVEKPAGVYTHQVKQMNQCAKEHSEVVFGVMFNQRTNQLYQQIKQLVNSGELGEIRRSNWIINSWWRPDSYYRQSPWRATWGGEGGGVLVNQAPHQLDLWQWICGMPKKVFAKCVFGAHRDISVENDVTIVTEYENGATGCFITSTHDPMGTDRLEIDLSGGKIVVENSSRAVIYKLRKNEDILNRDVRMEELGSLVSGNGTGDNQLYEVSEITYSDGWGFQHVKVMDNFARAVLFKEPLLAPGEEGINGVCLANACLLSSWTKKEIILPFDDDVYVEELNKHIRLEGKFPERII